MAQPGPHRPGAAKEHRPRRLESRLARTDRRARQPARAGRGRLRDGAGPGAAHRPVSVRAATARHGRAARRPGANPGAGRGGPAVRYRPPARLSRRGRPRPDFRQRGNLPSTAVRAVAGVLRRGGRQRRPGAGALPAKPVPGVLPAFPQGAEEDPPPDRPLRLGLVGHGGVGAGRALRLGRWRPARLAALPRRPGRLRAGARRRRSRPPPLRPADGGRGTRRPGRGWYRAGSRAGRRTGRSPSGGPSPGCSPGWRRRTVRRRRSRRPGKCP